jgi:hypothetical protein
MGTKAGYQKLNETLVALSIEIEDKDNVCSMLERKLESQRRELGQVENKINEQYEAELEAQNIRHVDELHEAELALARHTETKQELLLACKSLVDSLQGYEKEVAVAVKRIQKEEASAVEQAKRTFRDGQGDRLQKFLAEKQADYKSQTEKALQPELARLELAHESELSRLDSRYEYNQTRSSWALYYGLTMLMCVKCVHLRKTFSHILILARSIVSQIC